MQTIVIVEIACIVFLTIELIGQMTEHDSAKSSRMLNVCMLLVLFSLVIDIMAYAFMDDRTPFAFRYVVCLLAYTGEGIYFIGFAHYSEQIFRERTEISPWLFRVLRIAEAIWIAATAAAFFAGRMVVFENGVEIADNGYPAFLSVYQIIVMLYSPIVAFLFRKKIGTEAVVLLSIFNITPIVGILSAMFAYYDYSYVAAAVILAVITEFLQRKQAREQQEILAVRESLAENAGRILALEDNFEALYDVDMETGDYDEFVKGQTFSEKVSTRFTAHREFFEDSYKNIDAVAYPEDREEFKKKVSRAFIRKELQEKTCFDHYYRLLVDGAPVWFRMRVVYKNEERRNVIIGVFNAVGEVYARELAEKQRRDEIARIEAESSNRAKTEFLFNMSHDIRTPMNAILGYTDIALNHIGESERVRDSLHKIKTSGGHLLSLINDILEMSRIEAGKLEIVTEPLNVREVTGDIVNMSEALAATKDIVFTTSISDLEDPYIYADELHTNQIIINLISNAIKYTQPGGRVEYGIRQISGPENGIARYRITVKDNGIGMSEEFQQHLFESFARENTSTVSRQEGAGLGLAIVKRILDLMGGTISVQSRQGEGSLFTVELPLQIMSEDDIKKYRAEHGTAEEAVEVPAFEGKTVLLVEDNEMNREIATEMLTEYGMNVDTAEDGAIAVEKVRDNGADRYDFILMDIQMPVMNGYEATAGIRALPGGDAVPIIALSANAFKEDREKTLAAGMNAHVAKPINVRELLGTLSGFMGSF